MSLRSSCAGSGCSAKSSTAPETSHGRRASALPLGSTRALSTFSNPWPPLDSRRRTIGAGSSAERTETWPSSASCFSMIRGGNWNNDPQNVRVSYRNNNSPGNRNNNIGFRVLSSLQLETIPNGQQFARSRDANPSPRMDHRPAPAWEIPTQDRMAAPMPRPPGLRAVRPSASGPFAYLRPPPLHATVRPRCESGSTRRALASRVRVRGPRARARGRGTCPMAGSDPGTT